MSKRMPVLMPVLKLEVHLFIYFHHEAVSSPWLTFFKGLNFLSFNSRGLERSMSVIFFHLQQYRSPDRLEERQIAQNKWTPAQRETLLPLPHPHPHIIHLGFFFRIFLMWTIFIFKVYWICYSIASVVLCSVLFCFVFCLGAWGS